MKYVKMLGLAAVAAAALMAFVGASSASATVLCKTEGIPNGGATGTTCPEGWAYPAGTEIHAVLDPGTGPAKLVTAFKTIECEESTVKGTTNNEGSETETVTGEIKKENLTFGKCNCEVVVLAGGSLEIHWGRTIEVLENGKLVKKWIGTEGHDGTLTSTGAEVTTTCSTIFGSVHCIYKTNGTTLGILTGGATGTMDIEKSEIPRLTTNSLCTEKAEWSAKYEVTTPKPLWVTEKT